MAFSTISTISSNQSFLEKLSLSPLSVYFSKFNLLGTNENVLANVSDIVFTLSLSKYSPTVLYGPEYHAEMMSGVNSSNRHPKFIYQKSNLSGARDDIPGVIDQENEEMNGE